MGIFRFIAYACWAALALELAVFSTATAQEPAPSSAIAPQPISGTPEALEPMRFTGYFVFDWSGMPLGDIVLDAQEEAGAYHMQSKVHTQGLARLFTRHKSITQVNGEHKSQYRPVHYESDYKIGSKQKYIRLEFNADGSIREEESNPPPNPGAREEVPVEEKTGALDPLSLLMGVRENLWKTMREGGRRFSLRMYDGKRLTQVGVNILGDAMIKLGEESVHTIRVALSRTPLYGYKEKEVREIVDGDPPLIIYFSQDARMMPVALELEIYYGTLSGQFVRECDSVTACEQ